jgi:two-component system response regulator HydG
LNLLVVDDESAIREPCREVAETLGFSALATASAEDAWHILETRNIDLVLLDLRMPSVNGIDLLQDIKRRHPEILVVIMTGYASVHSAVQAMRAGAFDYVSKPFAFEELRLVLDRVAAHLKIATENRLLRESLRSKNGFGPLIGRAPEMEKLYRIISKAANSAHPVLILGESGTGKELVARSIHYCGSYRDRPFVPVDCGSLAPTLIESELFGYVRGAFTGAVRSKDGLLATANGGTVFLDEIGELPIDLQSKLLRALQEKEIRPLGSTRTVPVDVRILAATNPDLETAVQQGAFRRDLFFRLNVLTLRIPPLRERRQDIPLLAGQILERVTRTTGVHRNISDDVLRRMLEYDWPGNVRELENCLERACALSSSATLQIGDLPTALRNLDHGSFSVANSGNGHGILPLAELEKRAILQAIEELHGDKLEVARQLGIGKTTLYRKLKEYGTIH